MVLRLKTVAKRIKCFLVKIQLTISFQNQQKISITILKYPLIHVKYLQLIVVVPEKN